MIFYRQLLRIVFIFFLSISIFADKDGEDNEKKEDGFDEFLEELIYFPGLFDIYQNDISHINVSSGEELSINELASLIKKITGYKGGINFNDSMPDGTPRKILDCSFLNQKAYGIIGMIFWELIQQNLFNLNKNG